MINYKAVNVGDTIFVMETSSVLEFEIIGKFVTDLEPRLKLKGIDLTFEVDFKDVFQDTFMEKEEAIAHSMKYICDEVNELVRDLSDRGINDYIDLNSKLEKYKDLFPEIFI